MAEDKSRSPGNSSKEPDISDVIRVLRAAAGIGDNEQANRQLSREMPDKPSAEDDPELPKDRVEFSPEAMKKLSERSAAKAVGNARSSQSAADPDEALNALKIFREMSSAAGSEVPQDTDKPEVEASRSNAIQSPVKSPEKPSGKTSAKAAAKAENSPPNVDSDEAKNALDFFRKMSGVTGAQVPQDTDKPEVEASRSNAVKSPEKPSEEKSPKAVGKAESSLSVANSDEAKNALDFFRKMSGVTGTQVPQDTDKSEIEASRSNAVKLPEKLSGKTPPKAAAEAESSPPDVDSDEAKSALDFFRKMSGVRGAEVPQDTDKPEIEASRSNAIKSPEKTSGKTSAKATAKAESSPTNVDSDEAKNALDFFRKMSGVTGAQVPQDTDKSEVEASQRNAIKSPEKPSGKTFTKVDEKAKSSPPDVDSDEAKSALDFFRKMSGVKGAEVPQVPDKSGVEASRSNAVKSPEKPSGKTSAKVDEKAKSSPANVDSDEAENTLQFFREMSGATGSEPTEQIPDKSNDTVDKASSGDIRDEQFNGGQIQAENEQSPKDEPENAEQPRPYKPFDITDIPKTEAYVPPSDEPDEDTAEKCSLAVCGADCNDCPFGEENDCPGCGGLWEDCDIVRCAAVKGHEHCGLCDKFPCDLLREASFDPDSGDNGDRLLRLKSLGEAAGSRLKPRLIMAGGCGGIALGTAIGGFSGALLPWIFAMTVVGAGVGLMAAVSVKNKGVSDRGKKQT